MAPKRQAPIATPRMIVKLGRSTDGLRSEISGGTGQKGEGRFAAIVWPPLGLVLLCFAVLFLAGPLLLRLATGPWLTPEQGFSPIVIVMAIGMAIVIYRRPGAPPSRPANAGFALLAAGLLLFVAGSAVGSLFASFCALLMVLAGLVIAVRGWRTLRHYALPMLAGSFAAPLPGGIVTSLTFPLKMMISRAAAACLQIVGLPAANTGVLIDIGDYRLLVADACSGLQSIYSLMSIAVLVLFLRRADRGGQTIVTIAAAVPIVCVLNVARIFSIGLMAYYGGMGRAEGWFHGAAGLAMYVLAFFALMAFDRLMQTAWRRSPARG